MTKRYIAQFVRGGFPEIYKVVDTSTRPWTEASDPQPMHDAIEEADARNNGTWGTVQLAPEAALGFSGWFAVLPDKMP